MTRTAQLRVIFNSNCFGQIETVFYHSFQNPEVDIDHPPTIVNIKLFGNYYILKFKQSEIIDGYDIMKSKRFVKMNI